MTNHDYGSFIKKWTCFFLCIFPTSVPTPDYCSILAAIFLIKEAKLNKQDTRLGVSTLGLYSWLCQWPAVWPFPPCMETNITFVCLYFCSYILQVLRAKLSLHVQLVMHNKLPVLVMALTSSNTNINQIIVTKCQKNALSEKPNGWQRSLYRSVILSIFTSSLFFNFQLCILILQIFIPEVSHCSSFRSNLGNLSTF